MDVITMMVVSLQACALIVCLDKIIGGEMIGCCLCFDLFDRQQRQWI
jgi:hypothetical protein